MPPLAIIIIIIKRGHYVLSNIYQKAGKKADCKKAGTARELYII